MTVHLSPTDLRVLDDGPRVQDLRLAEALGFERPRTARQLIERHSSELQNYGEVCCTVQQTTERGGRPGREYWLNEPQALLICMFARTENAAAVRQMLIQVFMEWRREQQRAAAPVLPPPVVALLPDGPLPSALAAPEDDPAPIDLMARLAKVREARLIFGRQAAAAIWQEMGFTAPATPALRPIQQGRNCLAFLLGQEGGEGNPTVAAMIDMALTNGPEAITARDEIQKLGLKLVTGGLVVSNAHRWISGVFQGSEWDFGAHAHALRCLPGSRPIRATWNGAGQSRGTFVPQDELDRPFLA